MNIEFDNTAAKEILVQEEVWPRAQTKFDHGPSIGAAQEWWIDLLENITYAINEVDWHEVKYQQERYESIAREAAEQQLVKASKEHRVLALCDLSDLDRLLDDPRDGGVAARLTNRFIGTSGVTVHRHAGESPEDYEERRAQIEDEHEEESVRMLRLGSLAGIYLISAAEAVAERWAQAQFEAWTEANPEDDEDEDEE